MSRIRHLALGTLVTVLLIAGTAALSAWPAWQATPEGMAVLKLSFAHGGQRNCRALTEEEMAKLPPNMRRREVCDRRRSPVHTELKIDGALAFASDRSGSIEIYVRPLADAAVDRMVTSDGGHNLQPAWSPDGTQLAYHSAVKGGIWVVPLIGNFLLFLLALAAGVVVMAAIVVALKSRDHNLAAVDASASV